MEHSTDPLNLTAHGLNVAVYGADDLPGEFLDSVREFGVLTPLVVLENGTIVSGHRRWLAAKQLGYCSVPIRVISLDSELDIAEAVIEANRQREKTFSVMMREAGVLQKIEAERAKQRMQAGARDPESTYSQGIRAPQTREIVSSQVGIGSASTYDRAKVVWDMAKKGDRAAMVLVTRLDAGVTTIGAAYRELKTPDKGAPPPAEIAPGGWGVNPDEPVLHWWEHYPVLKALHEALDELWELDITEEEAEEVALWLREAARGTEGS